MTYPTALDTASTLYDLVNNLTTTVGTAYTSPATSLVLADASAFSANGNFIYVGGERATYTAKTGNTLTGISGLGNNHNAGETVSLFFDADHYNNLRNAVLALETLLGISGSADTNSIDYIAKHKPNLASANPVALGSAAPGTGSTAARDDHVHPITGLELVTNKATGFGTVNDTLYPTVQAVKTYADALVVGLLDDRGSYNASGNVWPSSGGSGTAGAILKGDLWYISAAGTLGGTAVSAGDTIRSLVDSPGTTASNWDILIAPVSVAGQIHAATDKATPVDADEISLVDSVASYMLKKLTWANLMAAIAAYTCTLTNKRITARAYNYTANGAAPSINTDSYEVFRITGQTVAITGIVTTGTPGDGDALLVEITSTNTAVAFNTANFEASGTVALPTAVTSGGMLAVGFVWNPVTSKWRCMGAV